MRAEIWFHPHDEYSDSRQLTHLSSEELYEYGYEDIASLYVPRTEIDPRQVEEGRDEAELRLGGKTVFRGPVEEVVRNDNEKELIIESHERYAERAEPGPKREPYQNVSDATVVREAIDAVPELSRGVIDPVEPSISKQFGSASPAFKIRKMEQIGRANVRYNPDGSVDFGRLHRNKSHYTLSPRRDNIEHETVEVDRESGSEEVTHLRMLGTGEGEHQVSAEAVADSWEPGDPEIWDIKADKSIGDEDTLQTRADKLVEELETKLLEVELTVTDVEVRVGDTFRVYIPDEDVDDYLQIVEHVRVVDHHGVHHELTLSNHRDSREDPDDENRADIDNYNSAIEGHGQTLNIAEGYQPVDPPDANFRTKFLYPPEVEFEHRMNLHVFGEPYRTYSAGSLDNADFESAFRSDASNLTHELSLGEWTTLASINVPDEVESSTLYSLNPVRVRGDSINPDDNVYLEFRYLKDDGYRIPDPGNQAESGGYEVRMSGRASQLIPFVDPVDVGGDYIDLEARVTEINADDETISEVTLDASHIAIAAGKHAHAPQPGVIEAFDDDYDPENPSSPGPDAERYFPTGCTVYLNGSELTTIEGDPDDEWEETIDLRGELRKGEVNEIRIEPDSIGALSTLVEGYVYERITGDIDIT